jgi:hypothetical protein
MLPLFRGSGIAFLSWAAGYLVTLSIFNGEQSAANYAVMVGWWLTAYVSTTFALPIGTIVPLCIVYILFFLIVAYIGKQWLYHDVVSLSASSKIWVGFLQSVLVASPIGADWLVRKMISYVRAARR